MLRNKHKRFTVCPFLQLWPSVDSMKRHGWPITVTVYERESYISRHPHIYQTPTVRPREFPRWQSASRMLAGVRRFNRFHQSPSFSIFHICSQTVIKISCSFAARDVLRWHIFFWLMQVAVCITENITVNHLKTCRIKERKYLYAKHFSPFFKLFFRVLFLQQLIFFFSIIYTV